MLRVTEIYKSLQGESTHVGRPCTFVRLTGCNLRCRWCDSEYTFHGGRTRSIDEVVRRVEALSVGLVEVTGGEPLLQPDVFPLMTTLCDAGYEVLLETSGAVDVSEVDVRVKRIVDIKCPGSGESERNLWGNLALLRPCDEVKLVVRDRADFDWGVDKVRAYDVTSRCGAVLWSAVHGQCDPADLAAWILETGVAGRLQVQLHKVVWPNADKSV